MYKQKPQGRGNVRISHLYDRNDSFSTLAVFMFL